MSVVQVNRRIHASFSNRYSLLLDGIDEYVNLAGESTLRFDSGSQDFSIFYWIKKGADGTNMIIMDKRDGAGDGYRLSMLSSNLLRFALDGIAITGASTITGTGWHLVGVAIDRDGNGTIYIDGLPNGTPVAISGEVMSTTTAAKIGTRSFSSSSQEWDGNIDEGTIWDVLFSDADVLALYNGGTPINPTTHTHSGNLITWLRMGDAGTFSGGNWTFPDQKGTATGTSVNCEEDDVVEDIPT